MRSFDLLSKEMATYENEVDLKTFKFLSKFNYEYCLTLKRRLQIVEDKKAQLENIKDLAFFRGFSIEGKE